jgi:pyruvate/2-oxoglutarate dehydrogenase complex dihydrolipoamide dehydrogenase (E3) component
MYDLIIIGGGPAGITAGIYPYTITNTRFANFGTAGAKCSFGVGVYAASPVEFI